MAVEVSKVWGQPTRNQHGGQVPRSPSLSLLDPWFEFECESLCETGGTGHSWQGHVEPWEVGLAVEVFPCSLWTWRQEWMRDVPLKWNSRFVLACFLPFCLCGTCFSLIAGMCGCSKPARSRAADSCLQPWACRCCNQCCMSHFFSHVANLD